MDCLPVELLKNIFGYLDELSLFYCSHVCLSWNELIDFYRRHVSNDQEITRFKASMTEVKFFSESNHLKTLKTGRSQTSDVIKCVMLSLGQKLLRIILMNIETISSVESLSQIKPVFKTQDPTNNKLLLTHLYLDNVVISDTAFVVLCEAVCSTLTHIYLKNSISQEQDFTENGLNNGISFLTNAKHLDLRDACLQNEKTDSCGNSSSVTCLLAVIANKCPNIEDLSVPDIAAVNNSDLADFLKSPNTRHLKFLLIGNRNITDEVEEGFKSRIDLFGSEVPCLTILTYGTNISRDLAKKYERPVRRDAVQSSGETVQAPDCSAGKIFLDDLYIPPYGSLDDYPFHKSFYSDWPDSMDDYYEDGEADDGSDSVSGSGSDRFKDHEDFYDDFEDYDGLFSAEEDYDDMDDDSEFYV